MLSRDIIPAYPIAIATIAPKIISIFECLYDPTILLFLEANKIIINVIGNIIPFKEPANISKVTGFPIILIIIVETNINPIIKYFSCLIINGDSVFRNETDVYAAPTIDVSAAARITTPNIL